MGGAAHAFMRPELVLFHTYLARNHITSGSFSTSIKVSIWCRPLNGRVKSRSRSQIMLPSLIDGPPLRGAPVRLPVEVIHKLCLIQLYFYPNNKMYLSKMQNIHIWPNHKINEIKRRARHIAFISGCGEYKFSIRTNIRIYLYPKNDTNEYPNIFVSKKWYERISEYIRIKKTIRTNIWIYSHQKNDTNMIRTNIRIGKYSNIFEYPNIRHTLTCCWYHLLWPI